MKNFKWLPIALFIPCNLLAITTIDINPDPKQGWGGRVALSISGETGTSDEKDYETNLLARHRHGNRVLLGLANTAYGKSNGSKDDDNALAHLRYIQRDFFAHGWDSELFVQSEYDEIKDLKSRRLAGGGVRLRLPASKAEKGGFYSFTGLGGFYEEEDTRSGLGDSNGVRINFYGKVVLDYSESKTPITFFSQFYLQPKVKDFNDTRATGILGFEVPLIKKIRTIIAYEVDYDSDPPPGIEETDTEYDITFSYSFD